MVGGAVAGLAVFAGAPVLGVAVGVAAGAVVAYGVGDYVHNYIADMPQQWDQPGVLGILPTSARPASAPGTTPST